MLELESERIESFNSHSPAFFSIWFYLILPPLPVFGRLWCCLRSVLALPCFHPFWHFCFFYFVSPPGLEGCWPVSRCFLSFCRQFSQPLFPVSPSASRSLPFPLIFMRLTGQPCSASLSLSVGEEAARCQQLMDFWKTQTVMHGRVQKCEESRRKGRIWRDGWGRVVFEESPLKDIRLTQTEFKVLIWLEAVTNNEICNFWL